MLEALQREFEHHFGAPPALVVRAPGRVNLIGEHTDYNDGFVLPAAIGYETLVALTPRTDRRIESLALDWGGETDSFILSDLPPQHASQQWSNYVRGVISEMCRRGYSLAGCNIAISGNVPQGAGLSSSAALEVSLARAIGELNGIELSNIEVAKIGQDTENNFVGCACGIMDQLISASGLVGHAVAIDCRSLETTPIPIPGELSILIVNSNVRRGLVDSEYNTRRAQCEAAARFFGRDSLRDVSLEEFLEREAELEPVVSRRARHVLEENERVLQSMAAMTAGDVASLGQLMAESHHSMRDLFEITVPEVDYLVEIISGIIGEHGGVRMTGGGFGGCVVALLPAALVEEVSAAVAASYSDRTGLEASIYLTRASQGAGLLTTRP